MANKDIKIVDVRSLNESLYDTIDITGYDSDDQPASKLLRQSRPKRHTFTKPALDFVTLISLAFKNSYFRRLTEQQVIGFIKRYFPYYQTADASWMNAIHDTLCMSPYFMRWTPCKEGTSFISRDGADRGLTWAVNPTLMVAMENLISRQARFARRSASTSVSRETDLSLLLAGKVAEPRTKLPAETQTEPPAEIPAEVTQKPLIFTEYKVGFLPLITLYAETPGDYKSVAEKYPVKF